MPRKTIRFAAAALALTAALCVAPAAHAAGLPGSFAEGWRRLVHLIGAEGMGLDPNGFKGGKVLSSGGATASATTLQTTTVAASTSRRR